MNDLFIVKIGGNVIDDEVKLHSFLHDFARIPGKKILVHGGGKSATRLAELMGIPQTVTEGRRITTAETLKVVTMVYAGLINKNIVARLQTEGCNAIGLTGADGQSIVAEKRPALNIDYGFVGDVKEVNASFINTMLENNLTPVFSPITCDRNGQLLNTNADTLASALATALSGLYLTSLVYCFEKNGVLESPSDDNSVIPSINPQTYRELKEQEIISAGMIPKLDNAFGALAGGVKKVIIGNSNSIAQLLSGESGTIISHE